MQRPARIIPVVGDQLPLGGRYNKIFVSVDVLIGSNGNAVFGMIFVVELIFVVY